MVQIECWKLCIVRLLLFFSYLFRWDEAHFGKFGGHYLQRSYYIDLHPPLAKMLVGLGMYLAKFDNSFLFESAKTYPDNVDYVTMRRFTSALGAIAVPVLFAAAHNLGLSKWASLIVASFALFDNGLVGITRPILLDSTLLLFTATTLYFLVKFIKSSGKTFPLSQHFYALGLGISMGLVASSKWVGLFSVALVGCYTIWDLWSIWSDKKRGIFNFVMHFALRAVYFILVPILVYAAVFRIHFLILNETGTGDAQMSSLFQASLKYSKISHSPIEVVYGSSVAIKNKSKYAGLLHSHIQHYPVGSLMQQVTMYYHRDQNNYWKIEKADGSVKHNALVQVQHGDRIRLNHITTNGNLRTQKIKAPITKRDWEVSCTGSETVHDENDVWIIEFKDKATASKGLQTFFTSFRLKHAVQGCYLRYTAKQLPEWGYKQGEVTCVRESEAGNDCIWNIEENVNKRLKEPEASTYKSRFIDDFIDLNICMYRNNNALVSDPEVNPSKLTSTPIEWPILWRGIRMCNWDDGAKKFYMFLNPIGGWLCLVCLIGTVSMLGYHLLNQERYGVQLPSGLRNYSVKIYIGLAGWALHYFPFFIMGRVLYFHHYYPAYLYGILNFGVLFDYTCDKYLSEKNKRNLSIALIAVIAAVFVFYAPICYGIDGPIADFKGRKWLPKWL